MPQFLAHTLITIDMNARFKEFKTNDQAIGLTPCSKHKIYAMCTASDTIIEKKSPYNY